MQAGCLALLCQGVKFAISEQHWWCMGQCEEILFGRRPWTRPRQRFRHAQENCDSDEHCDEAHSILSLVFGFAAYAVGGCDDLSCACLGLLCEFSRLLCELHWRGNLSGSDFWHGCCSCVRVYVVSSYSLVHSSLMRHPCMFWSFRPQFVPKKRPL